MFQTSQPDEKVDITNIDSILHYAFERSNELVWAWNTKTDAITVSGNTFSLLGFEDRFNSATMPFWTSNIHPDDQTDARQQFVALLKGKVSNIECSYRLKNKKNQWVWLKTTGTVAEVDENGRANSVIGFLVYIDEQKKLEQKYLRTQRFLSEAVAHTDDTLWNFDVMEDTISISDGWKTTLGLDLDKTASVSKNWNPLIHPDDLPIIYLNMYQLLKGETDKLHTEYRIQNSTGQYQWVMVRGHIQEKLANGRVKNIIGILTNINELKQQQALAVESEKQLALSLFATSSSFFDYDIQREMFTLVSHDYINNQLQRVERAGELNRLPHNIHPDDTALASTFLKSFSNSNGLIEAKWRSDYRHGDYQWFHLRGMVVEWNQAGEPMRATGTRTNITESYLHEQAAKKTDARNKVALQNTLHGVWEWDLRTDTFQLTSNLIDKVTEKPARWSATFQNFLSIVHEQDLANITSTSHNPEERLKAFCCEFRINLINQKTAWLASTGSVTEKDINQQPIKAVGIFTDISPQKSSEFALAEQKEVAETTLNAINDAVITTDTEANITSLNPTAKKMIFGQEEPRFGTPLLDVCKLLDEASQLPTNDPANLAIRSGLSFNLTNIQLINSDGTTFFIDCSVAPIHHENQRVSGAVMVIRDVSEARKIHSEIKHRAMHDSLTGLLNRQEFENQLHALVDTEDSQHAICYLDLDQFKVVNDNCGHIAGDELLRQIAQTILASIRKSDVLARLGGDEFGILMQDCDLESANKIAENILHSIADYTFHWEDNTFKLGVSIGIAAINTKASIKQALQHADAACFIAKEQGRNRVHTYESDDAEAATLRSEMSWIPRLQRAFENDQFELYSQTIVNLQEDQSDAHHLEVLVRLNESGNIISPGAFLPAAERYNLSSRLDKWVIEKTFILLHENQQTIGLKDVFNINLSAPSLSEKGFIDFIEERLKKHQIRPQNICFEITETSAIASFTSAQAFIQRLKALGCQFALDDFGSGLSSFGYLKNFPVDYLKIDGSFIKDILDDPIDAAMVRSINEIGQIMGKITVAEWVENEKIAEVLKAIGVNLAQGYHYSKPQPFAQSLAELS